MDYPTRRLSHHYSTCGTWRAGAIILTAALAVIGATAAMSADWTVSGRDGSAGVRTMSSDGTVELSGGCNARLGPGFYVTLLYPGEALQRVDDRSEPVVFEVAFRDGATQQFGVPMHYFAPDEAHVLSAPLPVAFLEAFARGDTLIIRNAAGIPIADWVLTGTAAAVHRMRDICGF